MPLVYVINIALASGSSLSPDSWVLTCADAPTAGHFRSGFRGSHAGTFGPPRHRYPPALTCHAGADDNLAILAAFAVARPGDVVVAACDGFTGTAVVGDLFAGMARNCQVAAIVTDGLARDTAGIIATGLPVFAGGVTPGSSARSGPGSIGLPVVLGQVCVAPGDLIVGDRDGVAVVPLADVDSVAGRMDSVRAAESSFEADVAGGLLVPGFIRALLSSDQVDYLD